MAAHNSPLRYPGGKSKLAAYIANICVENGINGHYIEPYAGGASVALFLLQENFFEEVTINDKDRSIYALWHSILNRTDDLCEMIEDANLTIDNWDLQRSVQKNKETVGLLDLGFSTLFMNRTNRSGIITGGMIGGREQTGNYKIDCRFNKENIIERIVKIAKFKEYINLGNQDAIELIEEAQNVANPDNTLIYFDPPYFIQGSSLYFNHYKDSDHKELAKKIKQINNIRWIVSYDNHLAIRRIYAGYRRKQYSFKHTANESKEGKEILYFSPNLSVSDSIKSLHPVDFKYKKNKTTSSIVLSKKGVPIRVLNRFEEEIQ